MGIWCTLEMSRFAIVTGGSRGLGAHLVRRLWLEGFSLGVVARSLSDIQLVLSELSPRTGQTAIAFACDLADPANVVAFLDELGALIPKVDVLVNNAAVQGPIGPLCLNNFSDWQRAIQINLLAPVALCRGMISLMRGHGGASIINLSGGGATGPRANFSAYATAKAGLVRFSETIAEELKADGIRVNCIAPGAMMTEMTQAVLNSGSVAGAREVLLAREVLASGGVSMDLVADLVVFLAGERSKGITGRLISAVWDNWGHWPLNLEDLTKSDVYTLRRIAGRDRGFEWGDK